MDSNNNGLDGSRDIYRNTSINIFCEGKMCIGYHQDILRLECTCQCGGHAWSHGLNKY